MKILKLKHILSKTVDIRESNSINFIILLSWESQKIRLIANSHLYIKYKESVD